MAPYLWFDQDMVEFRVLGSWADGDAPLEQRSSLQTDIRAPHDVPGMESAT